MAVNIYHCDGCGRGITATAADPVHKPGAQTLCSTCIRINAPASTPQPTTRASTEAKSDGRGAAAKARWEAKSPEEKAAHVAKMQAGRKPAAKREPISLD